MKYIPKRMISVMVEDEFVPAVVAVITKVNRTGNLVTAGSSSVRWKSRSG